MYKCLFQEVDKAIIAEYEKMKVQHASMKALTDLVSQLPQLAESINGAILHLGKDIRTFESRPTSVFKDNMRVLYQAVTQACLEVEHSC